MDTNLHIKITADGQAAIASLNRVVSSVNGISKGLNGDLTNQNSFFSQSTMALMSGTGSMIKGVGDQINRLTGQIRTSRVATEQARNGLASMGMAVEDLDTLENTARTVGESFAIGKDKILDSAYSLLGGMSFLSGSALNEVMGLGVQLGAATKAGSETISNLLANAGNTLGASLQSDEQKFVEFQYSFANSSAAIVNLAKAEGNQIASYTKNVGTALKDLGQDMTTQQAIAGSLITLSGSGEKAATLVGSGLAKAWTAAFPALNKMGISTTNADGSLRNMIDVIGDLKAKTAGMDAITLEKTMSMFKGLYAQRAVKSLMNDFDNLKRYQQGASDAIVEGQKAARKEIDLTSTMMGKMASAFQQGPGFTMDQLRVKQQNLMEEIAKSVSSAQSPFISLQGAFVQFAQKIVSTNPKLVGSFMQFGEVVGGAVSGFGTAMQTVGNIGRGLESLKLFQSTMSGFFGGRRKPVDLDVEPKIKGPSLISKLTAPLGGAISAGFGKVKGFGNNLFAGIRTGPLGSAFEKAMDSPLGKVAGKIGSGIKGINWKGLGSGLLKGAGILGGGLALAMPFLMKDKTIGPQLQSIITKLMSDLKPILQTAMNAIKPLIPVLSKALFGIFEAVKPLVPVILDLVTSLVPPLAEIVTSIVQGLAPFIPMIVDWIKNLVSIGIPIFKSILEFVRPILPPMMQFAQFMVNILKDILKGIIYMIPESLLSTDMKQQKYAMLMEERGKAGDTLGAQDAAKQAVAYGLEAFGIKDVNYSSFDADMARQSPEVQAAVNNLLKNDKLTKLSAMDINSILSKTMSEGVAGRVYDSKNNNKLITSNFSQKYAEIANDRTLNTGLMAKEQLATAQNRIREITSKPGWQGNFSNLQELQTLTRQAQTAQNTIKQGDITINIAGNATPETANAIGEAVNNHMSNAAYELDGMLAKRNKADSIRNIPKQG